MKVFKYLLFTFLYMLGLTLMIGFLLGLYFIVLTNSGRISAVMKPDNILIGGSTLICNFGKEITISTNATPFVIRLISKRFEVDGNTYIQQTNGMYTIKSDDTYYNPPKENDDGIIEEVDLDFDLKASYYKISISSNKDILAKYSDGLYGVNMPLNGKMRVAPSNRGFMLLRSEEPIVLTFEEHKMMLTDGEKNVALRIKTLTYPANTDLYIYTNGEIQEKMGVLETMEEKAYYDVEYDVLYALQFEDANSVRATGTGKVYYYTTANPKIFELEHQEIYVPPILDISDRNSISGELEDGRFMFQGQVETAEIMGHNIKHTLWSWMNESSNLIASMILTVLGGAISLTIVTLKKED